MDEQGAALLISIRTNNFQYWYCSQLLDSGFGFFSFGLVKLNATLTLGENIMLIIATHCQFVSDYLQLFVSIYEAIAEGQR